MDTVVMNKSRIPVSSLFEANTPRPVQFPQNPASRFRFVDLFSGIGGIRLAFQRQGGQCVFSSEINEYARRTYQENFGEIPFGDIRLAGASDIPDHDILLAGFPCQPFSIAGVSKKNSLGRKHGFECTDQGNLFFEIVRIISAKRPFAFFLENVKNLMNHDGGNTFRIICQTLEKELEYKIKYRIIDARHYVPQHRERIYIVGFDASNPKSEKIDFAFPEIPAGRPVIKDIIQNDASEKYTLSDKLWEFLQIYSEKHRKMGNGFGFGLADLDGVSRTLSARYYKDGSEILIPQKGKNPRRLTPRECARLMGFPDEFVIPVSDTQAYRQFGNSVVVPVVEDIARRIVPYL